MVKNIVTSEPLLPSSNAPSYSPLTDGPVQRRPTKEFLVIFAGLVMIGLFAGLISTRSDIPVPSPKCDDLKNSWIRPDTMGPATRSVSAGVSDKSNRLFGKDFPWNDTMLSWQRTAFHFQPEKNWMNGPLYYMGWYHFFYQYNPNAAVWGDIVWGHAVSKDLIHWLYLPLAMVADKWYDIQGVWTGSATFLPDGKLIMLYTGSTNESVQVQNLAYPADPNDPLLIDWVKYSGNPVLVPPPGILPKDFRDPTTAWYTKKGKWRLIIGSKINRTGVALVYDTKDFKIYELLNGTMHGVDGTGMWECVDFYPVSMLSKNGLDTSINGPGVKHVVKTSLDDDRHDYYSLGSYYEVNGKWVPDNPKIDVGIGLRYDYGNFYASKTFFDQSKSRRILWGWITESDSEASDKKKGWASLQGIPRTVVYDQKTGRNLLQWPVKEVENLRLGMQQFDKVVVKPGSVVPLDVDSASQLDIVAEFMVDKAALESAGKVDEDFSCKNSCGSAERGVVGPFGIIVLADRDRTEQTPIYFYIAKGSNGKPKTFFCTDQTRSSMATDVKKERLGSVIPVLQGEKLSLRILVDHSIVESFAQGGRSTITARVYPTKAIYDEAKIFLFNNATKASVTATLTVWQMNSAFIRPFPSEGMRR
ncbi:hypothetical protein ACFE04_012350 [Oxalis oulophora]